MDLNKSMWLCGNVYDYGENDQGYYEDHPNTILKRTFVIKKKEEAILRIASLGFFVAYLNDKRIGNDELNDDWTNYDRVVYYTDYSVSDLLVEGENELKIELGNGRYNGAPLRLFGKYNLRERVHYAISMPKVILSLKVGNQVVLRSDEAFEAYDGHYLFNNLYLGERYDYTYRSAPQILHTDIPHQHFEQSLVAKSRKTKTCSLQHIFPYKKGFVIDFGEMISGFIDAKLDVLTPKHIHFYYSERFRNGQMDYSTSLAGSVGERYGDKVVPGGLGAPSPARQHDEIIVSKGEIHFTNQFAYHSFRYVYLENVTREELINIQAIYVHDDLNQEGSIEINHPFYQDLYEAGLKTKLNNIHSVFEDCARERLGYGGDVVALALSNLYLFDLNKFYRKIIHDFRYEQTKAGGISETAPFVGIGSQGTAYGEGPLLWQFVYPYIVYRHYQFYGDRTLLEEEYPYLTKQLQYLLHFPLEEVVEKCIGDHGSSLIAGQFYAKTPDKLFIGYVTILMFIDYNMRIAKALNKDISVYQSTYQQLKERIEKQFIDGQHVGDNTQSGYAFALYAKLGQLEEVLKGYLNRIKEDGGIFNNGIFGMSFAYEVLHQYGYDDVIEKWLLHEGECTFKHMLECGNQALSELFVGEHMSLNHAMFSSYMTYYYLSLAGICVDDDAVGCNKITLKPYFSKQINDYKATLHTIHGTIVSQWQRLDGKVTWTITIPENIQFNVSTKCRRISQNAIKYSYEVIES